MSQVNFDALANEHPELRQALRVLQVWMEKNRNIHLIVPRILYREISKVEPEIKPETLARALRVLTREGLLQQVYKVVTPNGVLAEGEFDDPTQIPSRLPDRREKYFDTDDSDVIPVFRTMAR